LGEAADGQVPRWRQAQVGKEKRKEAVRTKFHGSSFSGRWEEGRQRQGEEWKVPWLTGLQELLQGTWVQVMTLS
jgi:hypothetical protein